MTALMLSGQSNLMEDINKGMIKTKQSTNLMTRTVIDINTDCGPGEWEVHFSAGGTETLQK